ncbi:myogenic factor 6 [Huso huso]|uniref:Myogenic factor 6 n=1 Tax=Huso huso TaxID=61971 RepID=A0ABR0ZUC9_HUSHU
MAEVSPLYQGSDGTLSPGQEQVPSETETSGPFTFIGSTRKVAGNVDPFNFNLKDQHVPSAEFCGRSTCHSNWQKLSDHSSLAGSNQREGEY